MAAVVVEIAEAVRDALNGASLSMAFDAERLYVPRFRLHAKTPDDAGLPDLETLRVSVVPRELSLASLNRGADDFDYVVDVAIQKRLDSDGPAEVDPYMLLAEEVVDLFRGKALEDSFGRASCVQAANLPIYSPEFLNDANVFTSVVTLTFRLARARTA